MTRWLPTLLGLLLAAGMYVWMSAHPVILLRQGIQPWDVADFVNDCQAIIDRVTQPGTYVRRSGNQEFFIFHVEKAKTDVPAGGP